MKHCHKIIQREFAKLMIVCRLYLWLQTTSIRTIEEITNHNVLWYDIKCLECVWTTCAQHIYVLLNLIFAEICLTVMVLQRFGDASFRIKYPIQELALTHNIYLAKSIFAHSFIFVWSCSPIIIYFRFFVECKMAIMSLVHFSKTLFRLDDFSNLVISAILLIFSFY